MKTITRGSGSRVGFVLADEKRFLLKELEYMDDFTRWLA